MTLFERTKNLSKQKGWSLQTTAEKAGLSQNAIYNWKTKEPSKVSLKAVADVLGVSSDYLLGKTKIINNNTKQADIEDDDLMLAFDGMEIDEEDKQAIIELLKFRRFQKGNNKN